MPMPHTVPLHADETALSFAARVAFANKLPSLSEFLKDFDLAISDVVCGSTAALARLAELGDVESQLLVARAFCYSGDSHRILGFQIDKQNLLVGYNRVCPACLRADMAGTLTEQTVSMAYGRILWSFASARVCPVHNLLLVAPPEENVRYEFMRSWEPWLIEIEDGDLDRPVPGHASFEHYLSTRLAGGAPGGWAANLSIGAAGVASEMLGASLVFGKGAALRELSAYELAVATDAGFALLNKGPDALLTFFQSLRAETGSPQDRPSARYGRIHDWMRRGAGAGLGFGHLRDILRQHILETWPLGEGELALDYPLPARRLHSIRTAALAHDLHPKRLRRLLRDAGIVDEPDTPDYDVLFSAPETETLLDQASGAVSYVAAQRRLGMTRTQMERLIAEGVLTPGEGGDTARPRFTEATIRKWSNFFEAFPETSRHCGKLSISETSSSLGVSTAAILRLIVEGRLRDVERNAVLIVIEN
ncbi:TniQ family protein [Roseovarius dicentrarchi]|uniref:TniQ family protein n=1 Tax=Roseovarius dicentrarchi TaxID=2250573 RepID=UPI000DEB69F2|nr:TniQ family protein [Roseovarius dicentrarchi]